MLNQAFGFFLATAARLLNMDRVAFRCLEEIDQLSKAFGLVSQIETPANQSSLNLFTL